MTSRVAVALGTSGEIFFPGPAHTVDDAAVWIEEARILVGGCMVRSLATERIGNTANADLAAWPDAIRALQRRYPDARIVLPGHGDPGGPELSAHTLRILDALPGEEGASR